MRGVLDESSWKDGTPSERSLVCLFAAMTPESLDRFLRDMVGRALVQLELRPSKELGSIREVVNGTRRHQELDESEWEFPGGDYISDAVQALEDSSRMRKAALKSLGHAVEAAGASVGALIEHRDSQRDPDGWARFRKRIAEREPFDPTDLASDRMRLRERDRPEVWRLLLAGLKTDSFV